VLSFNDLGTKSPAQKSRAFCLQKHISHDTLQVDDSCFRKGAFMRMVRKYGLALLAASALLLPWNVSAKGGEVPPPFSGNQSRLAAGPLCRQL